MNFTARPLGRCYRNILSWAIVQNPAHSFCNCHNNLQALKYEQLHDSAAILHMYRYQTTQHVPVNNAKLDLLLLNTNEAIVRRELGCLASATTTVDVNLHVNGGIWLSTYTCSCNILCTNQWQPEIAQVSPPTYGMPISWIRLLVCAITTKWQLRRQPPCWWWWVTLSLWEASRLPDA